MVAGIRQVCLGYETYVLVVVAGIQNQQVCLEHGVHILVVSTLRLDSLRVVGIPDRTLQLEHAVETIELLRSVDISDRAACHSQPRGNLVIVVVDSRGAAFQPSVAWRNPFAWAPTLRETRPQHLHDIPAGVDLPTAPVDADACLPCPDRVYDPCPFRDVLVGTY